MTHAISRAHERYNLTLSTEDIHRFRSMIADGHPAAIPLATSPGRSILIAIRVRRTHGRRVWLATLWRDENIVTVLPKSALWKYERKIGRRESELNRAERVERSERECPAVHLEGVGV